LVSVINTSDEPSSIEIPNLQDLSFEIFQEANIMNVIDVQEESSNSANRLQKLKNSIRTEHMSTEER
jgi:hypothetical protein